MRPFKAAAILALAGLLPVFASACVLVYPTVDVSRSFRARAMDRGRPVAGLRLVLQLSDRSDPTKHSEISSITDANGYAQFRNINPGSYFLQADHDAFTSDGANIDVSPGGATDVTVTLQWPNMQPLQVRSLSGQMLAPDYYPEESQSSLSLSLLEGVSARVIATVQADDQGRFAFSAAVPPGLYFIRLNTSDGGLIGVALSPTAALKQLDGYIAPTDCGLGFIQRHSVPPVTASNICGDVYDSQGAPIRNARVILMDINRRGKILDQSLGSPRGRFELPGIPAGTYQMLVMSRGWVPFLQKVRVQPGGTSGACAEPMHVQLNPLL
jgi:hypothetical protein